MPTPQLTTTIYLLTTVRKHSAGASLSEHPLPERPKFSPVFWRTFLVGINWQCAMRKFHLYGLLYLALFSFSVSCPSHYHTGPFCAVMGHFYPRIPTVGGFGGGLRGLYMYTHTSVSSRLKSLQRTCNNMHRNRKSCQPAGRRSTHHRLTVNNCVGREHLELRSVWNDECKSKNRRVRCYC